MEIVLYDIFLNPQPEFHFFQPVLTSVRVQRAGIFFVKHMRNWKKKYRQQLNRQSHIEPILHTALQKNGMGARRNRIVRGKSGRYYFIDLYIRRAMLGIEIDGKRHDPKNDKKRDRDILAAHRRWKILRFSNYDVMRRLNWVLNRIRKFVPPVPIHKSIDGLPDELSREYQERFGIRNF